MVTDLDTEPLDNDFIDYIARRQGVDRAVAFARLSEWLYLCFRCQPPPGQAGPGLAYCRADQPAPTAAFAASLPAPR